MGKSSKAPDPYQTAAAQTQSNEQTAAYNAALNRTSQYTPYGNSVYSQTGVDSTGAPMWSNTITLTPESQKELTNEQQQDDQLSNIGFGLADQAQSSLASPVSTSGLPALQYGANGGAITSSIPGTSGQVQTGLNTSGVSALPNANDYAAQVRQAQDAAYGTATRFLDPQYQNAQNDLDAKLANQGVVQGSDAYNRAETQLSNQKAQAYGAAQDSAVAAGNAEQNTLFGQGVTANQAGMQNAEAEGNFANTAQQQQYSQNANDATFANAAQAQNYSQGAQNATLNNSTQAQALQQQAYLATLPLNELNALRSGTQIQNPTFTTAPQSTAANTDVSGDVYRSYQLDSANQNNVMDGLFSLGSAGLAAAGKAGSFAALFSDRRLKRDIVRVGTTPVMRLPVYEFAYRWAPRERVRGVMADEVARIVPHAVLRHPSGYRMVDYRFVA